MGTSREEIRTWLKEGKAKGATHTLIVCDTFDHEDYPVHVMPGKDVRAESKQYDGTNMQRVMEVYSHALDHETQMSEPRSFHWEYPTQYPISISHAPHVSDMALVLSKTPEDPAEPLKVKVLKARVKKGSPKISFEETSEMAPMVGMEIYVPTAWYIDRGEDDVQGGLATIEKIEKKGRQTWVYVKEVPGRGYSLEFLLTIQKKLKAEFGENRAHPDPDLG